MQVFLPLRKFSIGSVVDFSNSGAKVPQQNVLLVYPREGWCVFFLNLNLSNSNFLVAVFYLINRHHSYNYVSTCLLIKQFDLGHWPMRFLSSVSGEARRWPTLGHIHLASHPPCYIPLFPMLLTCMIFGPVGWGCRIHRLQRGNAPNPTSVLDMTRNNLMVRL